MPGGGSNRFVRLLLPAIVLQSVLIGGGYASGREVVEFGAKFGALGWVSVLAILVGFTTVSVLTFEFARQVKAYDYKRFIQGLIGPLWPLFDLLFAAMAVLIIAIMASAAGTILEATTGLPYLPAILAIVAAVGVLSYQGAGVIERFKTAGTALLYVGYLLFGGLVLAAAWPAAMETLTSGDASAVPGASMAGAAGSGILYVGYNLAVYPAVLFTLHRQSSRRDTVGAGVLSGALMTLPFVLTYLCLLAFYPDPAVLQAPVPWLPMLESVAGSTVLALYGLVVGWTLLETSVGLIHALLDRVDRDLASRSASPGGLAPGARGVLGAAILVLAALLAQVGIVELVATGYTAMAYAFLALFLLPLATVGVLKILRGGQPLLDRRLVVWLQEVDAGPDR